MRGSALCMYFTQEELLQLWALLIRENIIPVKATVSSGVFDSAVLNAVGFLYGN